MTLAKRLAAVGLIAAIAAPAHAVDGSISVGPSLVTDGDVRIWGPTLRGSLFFNDYFGIEAEGTIGAGKDDLDVFTGGFGNLDSEVALNSQLGAFAVGRYPFAEDQGSVFVRLGYMDADFDIDIPAFDSGGITVPAETLNVGFDNVAFGIGGEFYFNGGPHGIRGDVTSITGDGNGLDGSIQTISLTYSFRFGG